MYEHNGRSAQEITITFFFFTEILEIAWQFMVLCHHTASVAPVLHKPNEINHYSMQLIRLTATVCDSWEESGCTTVSKPF